MSLRNLDPTTCITSPAARKRDALKTPWLINCPKVDIKPLVKSGIRPAAPAAKNIYPS